MTHMLLSVGQDFPEPREELDPGLLSQRGRNVAELNEGTEQCSRLWGQGVELRCILCLLHPHSRGHKGHG